MASTAFEIMNRTALGALVVVLTMSALGRSPSHAAIATRVDPKQEAALVLPKRRGPAPAMLGQPMTFEGESGGQYPSEAWRTYMNGLLAQAGYGPIDGCSDRMRTEAFVYQENCDGEMVFVSGIYRATASMLKPASSRIDVRTGTGLPPKDIVSNAASDIVDRSAGQRMSGPVGYATPSQPIAAVSAAASSGLASGPYVDESVPILNAPVPQTRRRPSRSASAE